MTAKQILDLKNERATVIKSIRDIMNEHENKEMDAPKKSEFAKLENRADELTEIINREERQLERERGLGEENKNPPMKDEVMDLFIRALAGDPAHVAAYQSTIKNAMSLGSDADGGSLTAPMNFVNKFIKGLDDMIFIRKFANVVGPIGAAQSLGFPTLETDMADAEWVPEVTAAPEDSTMKVGRREFKPNKMAKLIKVSRTLIRHAPLAEGVVLDRLLAKVGASQEKAYLTGDGSAKPLGLFNASAQGINTDRDVSTGNTATAVTFDGLINAKFSIKQQYWPNMRWILHRDLAKMLAKVKNGEGQYVWQPSVIAGQPDGLLGFPVHMSEYAPNTYTAGLYAAVLGDLKNGYWICDAADMFIQILKELYATTGQIGYMVDYFGDGMPVLPEAFARVKMG